MGLRVLHLASWYPTTSAPHAVPFVKAHVDALAPFVAQEVVHVEVSSDGTPGLQWRFGGTEVTRAGLTGLPGPTRLREWLTLAMLAAVRLRLGRRRWDVVVVHVAWPTYRYPKLVRALFGRQVVVIEHWSAYASQFHLDPSSRAHARMRRIFATDTPILAVSQGLARDIRTFAQRPDLDIRILPNVVDAWFHHAEAPPRPRIFMAASWNRFRLPFQVLEAMPDLVAAHPDLQLVIAGEGPQFARMKAFVAATPWAEQVEFLGSVPRERIAEEMRRATIFAHPTTHETFSVVTAEAMCCGTPALVSDVGALPELVVPGETGELLPNDTLQWRAALLAALAPAARWDRAAISARAGKRFAPEAVGQQLYDILTGVARR